MKVRAKSPTITPSHKRDWEDLAQTDPLWAIASDPSKKGGRWKQDEFFRSGAEEIGRVMSEAALTGLPRARHRSLDFGCGVGRLTRAMAAVFEEAVGIDISASMISQAKELNPECVFFDLANFDFPRAHFDFIYTSQVLQHQPSSQIAKEYISILLEMLAPGGLLVFHVPYYLRLRNRIQLRRRVYNLLRSFEISPGRLLAMGLQPIRMITLCESDVVDVVKRSRATVLRTQDYSTKVIRAKWYYCALREGSTP